MKYTIVIPVFNKEETLYRAIKSALNQSLSPSKIIIVDDASTDQSLFQLEPFLNDQRMAIVPLKQNLGISQVLNIALKYIDTPYFLQVDGDDWLEPHAAEQLVRALERNTNAAFAYGNHQLWEYDNHYKLIPFQKIIQPHFNNKYDFLLKLGYMLNPRCYRTKCVQAIGGWETDDPWKGRYYEDGRMIIRLAEKYEWIHITDILHNVLINREKSTKKIPMYNHLRKSFYEKMLKRWGNKYLPVWKTSSTGRIVSTGFNRKPSSS